MTQQELYRFYRSNLPTVVWSKELNGPIAEFVNGQFYTKDPKVAQLLKDKGYPRISLEATEPPDILFKKGEIVDGDIKQLPSGITEGAALNQEMLAAQQERLRQEALQMQGSTPAPAPKPENKDLSPAMLTLQAQENEKPKTETKVRKIKRRKAK